MSPEVETKIRANIHHMLSYLHGVYQTDTFAHFVEEKRQQWTAAQQKYAAHGREEAARKERIKLLQLTQTLKEIQS